MHSLHNARSIELMYGHGRNIPVLCRVDEFHLSRSRDHHLGSLVYIAVCMTRQSDGLSPRPHIGLDSFYDDGRPEYGPVQKRPDRPVGALPHLLEMIFLHPGCVGSDRRALHCNPVFLRSLCRVHRHLIIRPVPVLKAQVIIFRLQLHERFDELLPDHLPEDPCHLISVHLHQRCVHFNLVHIFVSLLQVPHLPVHLPGRV